jgi:hypothetical protein
LVPLLRLVRSVRNDTMRYELIQNNTISTIMSPMAATAIFNDFAGI